MELSGWKQEVVDHMVSQISLERMMETVEYFSHLHRYTGYPDGERAAGYLAERLADYGIPHRKYRYEAYLGLPLGAELWVTGPKTAKVQALADVFSAEAHGLEGELYYDGPEYPFEEAARDLDFMGGKIVLSRRGGAFARKVYEAGGAALLHVSVTKGDVIHYRGIGTVWGNPDLEGLERYPRLPSLGISQDGEKKLLSLLEKGPVTVKCSVKMDTGVRWSTMPVAEIPGRTEKFVLISGHYDSWYEGITDNAAADSILLELARVFYENRRSLIRGVKVAWWSGHSDGRYAGSTWYCDNQFEELRKNCVAHINLDLTGCRGAKQIRARTTLMEGMDFTADVIQQLTGQRPREYLPVVRGADQSFFGVNIPIVIMPKYEPLAKDRVSPCPGGGPWWHTDQDTMDKLSPAHLMRDAKLNATLAGRIAFSDALPVCVSGFLDEMERFLKEVGARLSEEFDLEPVFSRLTALREPVKRLDAYVERAGQKADGLVKETAGELARLTYSYVSPYEHDAAVEEKPFPGLWKVAGITREEDKAERYLAARTTFVRQRNRLIGQLEQVKIRLDEGLICGRNVDGEKGI